VEGEKLGLRAGVGALLILTGILVSELKGHVAAEKDQPMTAEMA
jgi:hypothetical protein